MQLISPPLQIILGSVAAYAPTLDLSPRAYVDLVVSIDAFEQSEGLPLIRASIVSIGPISYLGQLTMHLL